MKKGVDDPSIVQIPYPEVQSTPPLPPVYEFAGYEYLLDENGDPLRDENGEAIWADH